jgi:hypothetical protein
VNAATPPPGAPNVQVTRFRDSHSARTPGIPTSSVWSLRRLWCLDLSTSVSSAAVSFLLSCCPPSSHLSSVFIFVVILQFFPFGLSFANFSSVDQFSGCHGFVVVRSKWSSLWGDFWCWRPKNFFGGSLILFFLCVLWGFLKELFCGEWHGLRYGEGGCRSGAVFPFESLRSFGTSWHMSFSVTRGLVSSFAKSEFRRRFRGLYLDWRGRRQQRKWFCCNAVKDSVLILILFLYGSVELEVQVSGPAVPLFSAIYNIWKYGISTIFYLVSEYLEIVLTGAHNKKGSADSSCWSFTNCAHFRDFVAVVERVFALVAFCYRVIWGRADCVLVFAYNLWTVISVSTMA